MARALVHEIDHLGGQVYVSKAENGKLYNSDEVKEVMEREGLKD